jgi:DNA polymerase
MKCFKCDLCSTRKRIVEGFGNIESSIMFIGEAPGYHENKNGVPFCGKAGKELQKYLDLCNFNREEIYITNAIKCRPPSNRTPTFYEILACRQHLFNEFTTIKPKIVIFLGNVAISAFFNPYYSFSSIRNRSFRIGNTIFMMMYHPNYLLNNPEKSEEYTNQFKKIGRIYQYYNKNYTLNY